jgi:hypothetical protein
VVATWDDVPHLTEEQKKELWDSVPPHEREARAKGIPTMGSGAIYPVEEERYLQDPFDLPAHWPRAYGMDVGWNRTAAIWGAWDRTSDIVYLYSEHYMGQAEPSIHADAIKARGDWIPGAVDPASQGAGQVDGKKLMDEYRKLGLQLVAADNAVEAGIHAVYQRLSSGRLKVFKNLGSLRAELKLYRRDKHGKPVKENDHALDALRYLIMTGMIHAMTEPYGHEEDDSYGDTHRSGTTGY